MAGGSRTREGRVGRMAIGGLTAERLAPSAPSSGRPGPSPSKNDPDGPRPPLAGRAVPGRDGERGRWSITPPRRRSSRPAAARTNSSRPGRYLEARGDRDPAVLPLDRPARSGEAAPPLRDVSRGVATGEGRPGQGGAGRALADLLDRAPGDGRAGDRPRRPAGEPGQVAAQGAGPRLPTWRRDLLRAADAILPNSVAEGEQLVRWFGADPAKIRPVPNGVEERFARADPSSFRAIHGPSDFVLYVGRIEPRKNVLGLVEGVRSSPACRWW